MCEKRQGMGNVEMRGTASYRIFIATSWHYAESGSKNTVRMEMVGENGKSTGMLELDNKDEKNFMRGKTDAFDVVAPDVGLPLLLNIELGQEKEDAWVCRDIVVKYRDGIARFPIHDWIHKSISVTRARALTFSQVKQPELREMRKREVEQNKRRFQWENPPSSADLGRGLPRYVKPLKDGKQPPFFMPSASRARDVVETGFEAKLNAAKVTAEGFVDELDSFDEYAKLYAFLQSEEEPSFYKMWQTDEEFGRQQMNGISPTSFERCQGIPEGCQITNDHVAALLAEGKRLEDEIKARKVYIGDYSKVYKDSPRNTSPFGQPLYCAEAICLYYVNADDNLVPIAIQLVPGEEETIFTPKDSEEDWLLAKMYFKVAMGNMHQWYYHFLSTHNVMEPFSVSLFRCLPRSHPLYKLLRPHLQYVCSINDTARRTLVPKGSPANLAMSILAEDHARKMFGDFQFEDLMIPKLLKKKGLNDPKMLPKNYYRDDAIALWRIQKRFVADILRNYYRNDHDVSSDEELQDWLKDVTKEGFGWENGNARGVPESIDTVKGLIRFVTCLMFTCSVQHAAVNFGQYDLYKFIPNFPLAMRMPPHKRGEGSMDRIFNSLPDKYMSATIITLVYLLSSYSPDEVYIGEFPDQYFDEPETTMIIDNYKRSLSAYADQIHERNKKIDQPYEWLLPQKIPKSIAI